MISQFVKVTNDDAKTKSEKTVYGTVVTYGDSRYVKIDGSDLLTPVASTVTAKDGERVTIMIKNHSATITGNLSSPAARFGDVTDLGDEIGQFKLVMADKVTAEDVEARNGIFTNLKATVGNYEELNTVAADIENLEAKYADLEYVTADDVKALNAEIETLKATVGTFSSLSAEDLEAINAKIDQLTVYNGTFTYVSAEVLEAVKADIKTLNVEKLSVKDADIKYANVDFSNIGKAAMEYFYSHSGLIEDVVIGDATIAGNLVGVTIRGDLIEGNTIVAEKLVIKGEDGLYYKLNTDGMKTEAEQTDYNSLNGQVIRAKSVTAEKIAVEDLVAFGATIGGFSIGNTSIYSGVKESVNNTTRGVYMDNQGQIAFGDANNFIKYYKDTDGLYKLAISAGSLTMSATGQSVDEAISEAQETANKAIISSIFQFYHSSSPTELIDGEWDIVPPVWTEGMYIWRRTKNTYGDGHTDYSPSETGVCITGNTGAKGEDSTLLRIESSRGTVFKNDQVSTVLSVVIYHGSQRITDSATMKSVFGNGAYIQWKWQRLDDDTFGVISADDSRFGNDGFSFTLSPSDVDTKVTFMCELIT